MPPPCAPTSSGGCGPACAASSCSAPTARRRSMRDDEAARARRRGARGGAARSRCSSVGTGRQSTRDTIALSQRVARAGADAVLVLTPSVYRGAAHARRARGALPRHRRRLAGAGGALQHAAGDGRHAVAGDRAGAGRRTRTSPASRNRAATSRVVGDLVGRAPHDFQVVVGAAPTLYASLMVGARGGDRGRRQRRPRAVRAALRADARRPPRRGAARCSRRSRRSPRAVTTGFGVPGLKAAMALAGYRPGQPRRPLAPDRR